jgi:manganese/iron transport system ATP-binding protein
VLLLNRRQVAFGRTDSTLTPELLRAAYGGQALVTGGVVVAR